MNNFLVSARAALVVALTALTALATAASAQVPPAPSSSLSLSGPTWTLVEFQSMDDTTLKPEGGAVYTLRFASKGRLEVQADCARGKGAWKSPGEGQVEFGPVATSKIACKPSPLNTRFVKDLAYVRSYVFRDGKLYLSLMADGGIYAFAAGPSR